jgi:hypothetical protein
MKTKTNFASKPEVPRHDGFWAGAGEVGDTLSNHDTEKARSSYRTRRHMVTDDLYFLGKHKRGLFSDVSFNTYHTASSGLMIKYQ